jgi:hypothetical protein
MPNRRDLMQMAAGALAVSVLPAVAGAQPEPAIPLQDELLRSMFMDAIWRSLSHPQFGYTDTATLTLTSYAGGRWRRAIGEAHENGWLCTSAGQTWLTDAGMWRAAQLVWGKNIYEVYFLTRDAFPSHRAGYVALHPDKVTRVRWPAYLRPEIKPADPDGHVWRIGEPGRFLRRSEKQWDVSWIEADT